MPRCFACQQEIGNGGVVQEKGTILCATCDFIQNASKNLDAAVPRALQIVKVDPATRIVLNALSVACVRKFKEQSQNYAEVEVELEEAAFRVAHQGFVIGRLLCGRIDKVVAFSTPKTLDQHANAIFV